MNLSFSLPAPLLLSLSLSFSVSGSACYRSRVTARLCRANFPAHGIRWTSFYLPQTDTSDCLLRAFMKRYVGVCLQRRFEFEVLFANYPNAFFQNVKVLLPNWLFSIWSLTIYYMYSDASIKLICLFQCIQKCYCFQGCIKSTSVRDWKTCCFIQQSDA